MTVVIYGDKSNWWAACRYGCSRCSAPTCDSSAAVTSARRAPGPPDVPTRPAPVIPSVAPNDAPIRIPRDDVLAILSAQPDRHALSGYTGKRTLIPGTPEGHGPVAPRRCIPWGRRERKKVDGFAAAREHLLTINPDDQTIVYCRIGERSSATGSCSHTCWARQMYPERLVDRVGARRARVPIVAKNQEWYPSYDRARSLPAPLARYPTSPKSRSRFEAVAGIRQAAGASDLAGSAMEPI